MPISSLYILDSLCHPIISRNYRSDSSHDALLAFQSYIVEAEDIDPRPIFFKDGTTYVYQKLNDIYVLALTNDNADVMLISAFICRLSGVLESYFGVVAEESIQDNFVLIYEILDEMLNFGYPQFTDATLLKQYVTQREYPLKKSGAYLPETLNERISWRTPDIRYSKNEVFLDVVETVNVLMSASGVVMKSQIMGAVIVRSLLSGMPELHMCLNDRVSIDGERNTSNSGRSDVIPIDAMVLHPCVQLSKFSSRAIRFVPPDGFFTLLNYRMSSNLPPIIGIETVVDKHEHSRIDFLVRIEARQRLGIDTLLDVELTIPVPLDVDSPSFLESIGTSSYIAERAAIVWTIPNLETGVEQMLRAHFGLSAIEEEESQNPENAIQVKFEIPEQTLSGIQIKYVRIAENMGYQATPWVRYMTKNGDYQVRMPSMNRLSDI